MTLSVKKLLKLYLLISLSHVFLAYLFLNILNFSMHYYLLYAQLSQSYSFQQTQNLEFTIPETEFQTPDNQVSHSMFHQSSLKV